MSPLGEGRPSRFPGVDRAVVFFFHDPATPEIYTLSLHDALPILDDPKVAEWMKAHADHARRTLDSLPGYAPLKSRIAELDNAASATVRDAPHAADGRRCCIVEFGDRKSTRLNSSHVSISYAVFCL